MTEEEYEALIYAMAELEGPVDVALKRALERGTGHTPEDYDEFYEAWI